MAEVERRRVAGSAVLIDPRPPSRFRAGHIPGALNIQIAEIDPERPREKRLKDAGMIIVYGDDPTSAPARGMTKRLHATGYNNARMYAGGLTEWRRGGLPVEASE